MKGLYKIMLRLYPYDYRSAFESEMLQGFDQPPIMELAGLLRGAAVEWFAKITTDPAVRGRALPDVRMMRPAGMPRELWFGRIACSSDMSR